MEIKLQQQVMGTTGMDLTVPKTSEPDMKKKQKVRKGYQFTWKKIKFNQCPEQSNIQSPLPVKQD